LDTDYDWNKNVFFLLEWRRVYKSVKDGNKMSLTNILSLSGWEKQLIYCVFIYICFENYENHDKLRQLWEE